MIVRRCRNCREYRYLPDKGLCSDCINAQKEWVVIAKYGMLKRVCRSGLDKDEAEEIVNSKNSYFTAVPRDQISNRTDG